MSRHEPGVALRQMLGYAREAAEMVRGRSRLDLDRDLMLNRALTRTVEVIGEAARRVPQAYQAEHPDIPWRDIVALRNRLIHAYDQIDLDVLWQIVSDSVPALIAALEPLIPPLPEDE